MWKEVQPSSEHAIAVGAHRPSFQCFQSATFKALRPFHGIRTLDAPDQICPKTTL